MKNTLAGKKVVVVGGTSGIGLAVAEAAQREDARVTVASRRKGLDVTDETAVKAFFGDLGEIDHLVFTAGDSLRLHTVADVDLKEARAAFDVRVFAALSVLKYANVSKSGSITMTSGVALQRPQATWAISAMVLGAMEGLARALAVELAPTRVNVVSPGVVKTALWSPMGEVAQKDLFDSVGKQLLVRRVGEADEVAETYLHLMKSGFTTGQVVTIDGGATLV